MKLFSTEQVSKYHPDKYADQISDAILTECLKQDKNSHCGIEAMVKGNSVVLGGEITTKAVIDCDAIVRRVAHKLGYQVNEVINLMSKQSPEINAAVESDGNIGAGDQGIMFGYACKDTDSYLPYGFDLANKIIKTIENDVENNGVSILKGDAKCQVTVDLDEEQNIKAVKEILISVCHRENLEIEIVQRYVEYLISDLLNGFEGKLTINPSGTWTIGGPTADCGLTGRKIVCDQYGGYCAVGGGAFSGKDPSKVDRSASYMARKIAIDMLKEYGLKESFVQLGYAIGKSEPMSVWVEGKNESGVKFNLSEVVEKHYDLTPKGIIETLNLLNIDYETLAEGCHYRRI